MNDQTATGASAAAIRAHYDVGNDFYRLFLDESMTYSCAMWRDEEDKAPLVEAQRAKLDWHLRASGADRADSVLDIGCGWGGLLRAAIARRAPGAAPLRRAVGLTLSDAQAELARAQTPAPAEIRVESWADHAPAEPYGAIVSIGAFEHFTRPSDPPERKIEIYRHFFERCRAMLAKDGGMSLQTIAYGGRSVDRAGDPAKAILAQVFPDSDLPKLEEVAIACDRLFEIVRVRNDRVDYARTCEIWANNLRARRAEAQALVGDATVRQWERYLKSSSFGFWSGKLWLLRFKLRAL